MRRYGNIAAGVLFLIGCLVSSVGADVLKFDFERTGRSKTMAGFKSVTPMTDYDAKTGYGWMGAQGDQAGAWLEMRTWPGGGRGLRARVRAKSGIDALSQDWVTSSVPFRVDVPDGKYHVWVMIGDWGEYEFYPYGSYSVLVNDKVVGRKDRSTFEKFKKEYFRHKYDDYAPGQDLFEMYVVPRFHEVRMVAEAKGGKLMIRVRHDAGAEQYVGAINGVVVFPDSEKAAGEKSLKDLKAERKKVFDKNFPYPKVGNAAGWPFSKEEQARGFGVFPTPKDGKVTPSVSPGTRGRELKILEGFASRGEYEPLTFCVTGLKPHKDLGKATVTISDLVGSQGDRIGQKDIQVGYVKYLHFIPRGSRQVIPKAGLVMDRNWFDVHKQVTKQIWITVHVPEKARGGTYKGTVRVAVGNGASIDVPVRFGVIPLKLDEPKFALGVNYSTKIYHVAWFKGWDGIWDEIRKDMTLMREHGMTGVAAGTTYKVPVTDEDIARFKRFLKIYQDLEFPGIFYFANTMNLYNNGSLRKAAGGGPYLEAWQKAYCDVIRKLSDAAKSVNQKTTFSIGDETTNDAREGLAHWVAEITRKRIPDVNTCSDINGYRELMGMAPNLNIAGFNNGWFGNYGTNRPRRLMTRDVVERVKALGATPWYINGGKGRFPYGLFFWKSTKWGVEGHLQWHYFANNSDPYNPFDSQQKNAFGSMVYPGQIPTVTMENCREGIDDYRYLITLERLVVERAKATDRVTQALVARARDSLEFWLDAVDDARYGAAPDGTGTETCLAWPAYRMQAMRREIAQLVVMLSNVECQELDPDAFMLEGFEGKSNLGGGRTVKRTIVEEHASSGKKSLRADYAGGKGYVGLWGRMRTKDWRGYRAFCVDIFDPQKGPVNIQINFRDLRSTGLGAYELRHIAKRTLKPGKNTVKIDLVNMKTLDGKYYCDLSCMFNFFFTVDGDKDTTLYFDDIRLSRK